jgi:hypothetical protein
MHTKQSYTFKTKNEADEFLMKLPPVRGDSDRYVTGPVFMDNEVIFANTPFKNSEKYWQVTIEWFY